MSLFATDWRYMPQKYCFAACPPGMYCECSERMSWETSSEGRLWRQEQEELAKEQRHKAVEHENFKDLFEGL